MTGRTWTLSRCWRQMAVLAFLMSRAAAADEAIPLGVVVVVERDAETPRALGVGGQLREVLLKDARFTLVGVNELTWAGDARQRSQKADSAFRAYQQARAASTSMKIDAAAEKAKEAIQLYEQSDLTLHISELLDAMALKAFVAQTINDFTTADRTLESIFTLSPNYSPRTEDVNSAFLERAKVVRKRILDSAKSTMEVKSPVVSFVFVDGVSRGLTPLEVADLLPGKHYVMLRAPGYVPLQEVVQVGKKRGTFVGKLTPSAEGEQFRIHVNALRQAQDDRLRQQAALKLLAWVKTQQVLVVWLGTADQDFRIRVLRAGVGDAVSPSKVARLAQNARDEEIVERIVALMDSSIPAPPEPAHDLTLTPVPAPEPVSTASTEWIAYGTAGVSAASLVGGAIFGILGATQFREGERAPVVTPDVYEKTYGAARRSFSMTGVLLGASAVAGASAAWLFFRDSRGPMTHSTASVTLHVTPLQDGGAAMVEGTF